MNLNKLVHETRGKCCHEPGRRGYCPKCSCKSPRLPDYESSMDACMELWEESGMDALRRSLNGYRAFHPYPDDHVYRGAMQAGPEAETPQLAIIHAFIASKGVKVPKGDEHED